MNDNLRKEIFEWGRDIAIALVIVFIVRNFLFSPTKVFGQSMEPTLHEGNRLFVSKIHYRLGQPKRGDIVIFYSAAEQKILIKRIIALPGEKYEIDLKGEVYIDDSSIPLMEPYTLEEEYVDKNYSFTQGIVPDNAVFVMGDNRNDSQDSRILGYIPVKSLIGVAVVRFWPLDEFEIMGRQ